MIKGVEGGAVRVGGAKGSAPSGDYKVTPLFINIQQKSESYLFQVWVIRDGEKIQLHTAVHLNLYRHADAKVNF